MAGNADYEVDPANDDFFKRLINLRTTVKARLKKATALNRDALDSEQQVSRSWPIRQALESLSRWYGHAVVIMLRALKMHGMAKPLAN
jgi:hypothetical protein